MHIKYKPLKYLPLLLASSVFALTVAVSPLALAHSGPEHANDDQVTTSGSSSNTESHRGSDNTTTTNTTKSNVHEANDDSLRSQAKDLLETERQNHKEHTMVQRQQACQAHQTEINKRITNYSAAAARHLNTFNSIFTKVQAFQTNKQLNVPNYNTLVATAKDKQAAAQNAVNALKALDVNIDCSQPDPASSLMTLKTAVSNARTALQDYRTAIKNVIVALKGASTASTDATGVTE